MYFVSILISNNPKIKRFLTSDLLMVPNIFTYNQKEREMSKYNILLFTLLKFFLHREHECKKKNTLES